MAKGNKKRKKRKIKPWFKAGPDGFSLVINDEDVTEEVSALEHDGIVYVYHHPTGGMFMLLDYQECIGTDEWYWAEYIGDENFAYFFYDGTQMVFMVRGEDVSDIVRYSAFDTHMVVYLPTTGESFFGWDWEEKDDNLAKVLSYVEESEYRPIWYMREGGLVLHKGKNYNAEVRAEFFGDHVLMYIPEEDKTYWLYEAGKFKYGEFQILTLLGDGNIPMFYRTKDGYQLVWDGCRLGSSSSAADTGAGVIIYNNDTALTFFAEGGFNAPAGDWIVAQIIGEGVDVFWYCNGDKLYLYYRGVASREEDLRIIRRDGREVVLMDVARDITFGVEDFQSKCDGYLRPASL